ncbi:hypothetical protein U14_02610 [Candidatus Moduliflexus flocculans]|uniref:Uncharacterized protein n=1 Tax=Candidatus Moduliflexus flocculans TaxID=1499966 RepID=A0A081BLV1_9BACT|nr:hypothetical protein U14_02610 [Candidatus Moduliflexus flocculans]
MFRFKPFQGFLPVSTVVCAFACRRPCGRFQTLPGLLTGFYLLTNQEHLTQTVSNPSRASYRFLLKVEKGTLYMPLCFKPFQGFLPVSTSTATPSLTAWSSFKPFQGFLPVSTFFDVFGVFFETFSFKPFQGFLPVSTYILIILNEL